MSEVEKLTALDPWMAKHWDPTDTTDGHPDAEPDMFYGYITWAKAKELDATLQSQSRRVEELEGALRKAEGWFRDYERQHRAKLTTEGNLKADTNQERADFLRSVLLSEGETK